MFLSKGFHNNMEQKTAISTAMPSDNPYNLLHTTETADDTIDKTPKLEFAKYLFEPNEALNADQTTQISDEQFEPIKQNNVIDLKNTLRYNNRFHAPELVIHIIRTSENNPLSNFDNDEDSFGHGHRHQPHNKIPVNSSMSDRNTIEAEPVNAAVARREPTNGSIVVDPLMQELKTLEDALFEKKRNKLSALTDIHHGISEPQLLAPLSLSDQKSNNIRSVDKHDNNKQTDATNKAPANLLNTVDSFKDIVEKTETSKNKRSVQSEAMEDSRIGTNVKEEIKTINNRKKRTLQYFNNEEIGPETKAPLWEYKNKMKIIRRQDNQSPKDFPRKAAVKKKFKKAKKKLRNKKKKPKVKLVDDDCMNKVGKHSFLIFFAYLYLSP